MSEDRLTMFNHSPHKSSSYELYDIYYIVHNFLLLIG